MSNEKKLQVVIDGVEWAEARAAKEWCEAHEAEARAAVAAGMKRQYSKSTQDWHKVEESMMRWQEIRQECNEWTYAAFYIEPEDEAKALETCRNLWPEATIESGSGNHELYGFCHYVTVTFDTNTTDK